ncbi:hypothetical protein F9K50_04195 [bacterium]|nr:MAG: hypothetical protein F9K50_04195 [bacterium]
MNLSVLNGLFLSPPPANSESIDAGEAPPEASKAPAVPENLAAGEPISTEVSLPKKLKPRLRSKKDATPPDPANYRPELERSLDQHSFRWDNPHAYSVAIGAGYGRHGFLNGKGLEHHGLEMRLAAGFRMPLGKWRDHVLMPRLFYEYQGNNHLRIGNAYLSRAQAHRFGVELNYLYEAVPTWLQVGAAFSLGGAFYRTKDGFLQGLIFNGKALPRPIDSSGIHISGGALFCTFNGLACVKPALNMDLGMGLGLEPMESKGFSVSLQLDVLRIFRYPTPKEVRKKYDKAGIKAPT